MSWPATDDTEAWRRLSDRALQFATYEADLREAAQWRTTMKHLIEQDLPYDEFTSLRLTALKDRETARKREQKRIRWTYGRRERQDRLVQRDTIRLFERLETL